MLNQNIQFQKTIFTLLLFLVSGLVVHGQWKLSTWNDVQGGNAEVAFPALDAAYITSGHGVIHKSTDAGLTWTTIKDFGPFSTVSNPVFFNADTGYVSANFGLFRTYDGGANWTEITSPWGLPFGASISYIELIDETIFTSYVRSDTSYLAKSRDYGDSFSVIHSNYELNASVYLFSFTDSLTGHFINPRELEQIYKTSDGCVTVDTLFITNGPLSLEARFDYIDSQHGFLYGDIGSLSNPSRTWNTGTFYFPLDLDGVGILPVHDLDYNTSRLYACSAYGKIFYSLNDGGNWVEQATPSNSNVTSISFADENNGIAVSSTEVLYINNATTIGISEAELEAAVKVFPNPTSSFIQIEVPNSLIISKIQLYSIDGQLIKPFNSTERKLYVEEIKSGIYFLHIETEEGMMVKKIVKE